MKRNTVTFNTYTQHNTTDKYNRFSNENKKKLYIYIKDEYDVFFSIS